MKFNNLPAKVKKTPEQNAIAAFRSGNPMSSLHIVLGDMTTDQQVDFALYSLKNTKLRSYKMAIDNLEEAVANYRITKDNVALTKAKKSFDGNTLFGSVCIGILTLVSDGSDDITWISVIPSMIYEASYGEEYGKYMVASILAYRYNNTNFGLLYVN